MEKEYSSLKRQTTAESSQLSLYFLVFFLLLPGIPAIVEGVIVDILVTLATVIVCAIIYFWKWIPRDYVQFLAALVISSFNFCMLYMETNSFERSSKGLLFFRGYAFASVHVVLMSRFPHMKQKIFFLLFAYVFRFLVITLFDQDSVQSYTIIRHFYIDFFAILTNFAQLKKERQIFKLFYDYREELTKFKELLVNYLPQCIIVLNNSAQKSLFVNKAYLEVFDQTDDRIEFDMSHLHSLSKDKSDMAKGFKPHFGSLQVHKDTFSECETLTAACRPSGNQVNLKDFIDEVIRDKVLEKKPLSIPAFHSINNEHRSFELVMTKMKWDGEESVAVILNDTTDQEKVLTLKIADENKDKLIATVSHELRTPLNGIIGILDIAEKMITDLKILEFLELCKDNAYLLLGLVNSLLDLQQINQGKLRLNTMKIQVKKLFRDVIKLFVFQCNHKGLDLQLNIADDVPFYIYSDENRLKQILINLIGNALKFTASGGIMIEVRNDPDSDHFLQISVNDTGIGIKEEDLDKLFKMYGRIESSRKVNQNGVGLGLMISNTLASILKGTPDLPGIEVKSRPREGSQFIFKILKQLEKVSDLLWEEDKSLDNFGETERLNLIPSLHEEDIPNESPKNGTRNAQMNSYAFHKNPLTLQARRSEEYLNLSGSQFKETKELIPQDSNSSQNSSSPTSLRLSQFSRPQIHSKKGFILAVDDNPFNLLVIENIIKSLGYSTMMAKNGEEAIEVVKKMSLEGERLVLILMDCQMPIMDGFETTIALRTLFENGELKKVPIVGLSANNSDEDIKKCLQSGMDDFLSKPLITGALIKILSKLARESFHLRN